ncbi:MAG: four helix bundle protein [Acidobacteria bacterium]|nr:four helix bundle protein [Acidobacteriota bacterium]
MAGDAGRERTLKLQRRDFDFSSAVLGACPKGPMDTASKEVWEQLVGAATSTANNLEEADAASSRADFRAKMRITLREAKETRLCLRLLTSAQLLGHDRIAPLLDEAGQLVGIFTAIVKKVST